MSGAAPRATQASARHRRAVRSSCSRSSWRPALRAEDAPPTPGDWNAIKRVIGDQRDALRRRRRARVLVRLAATAATVRRLSRRSCAWCTPSYQPLIDARYVEFLEGAVIDGRLVQPLRLALQDGTVLVAIYTMETGPDADGDAAGASPAACSRRRRVKPATA